ncbi:MULTISPECIES: MSC_0620 family F1-like ATPase-associated subunit [unclassified Mycoplasma]|uniref:MSC_0620 family F1-like ATPase-associated subunit n=1 Tax=unclassified Mycoplasma TaxID=2683645 RepID=UPI00211BD61A|nr:MULTISPECIES: hypothetical protein [unclassified Mycoplasma]UUM19662.1 hypothetical protein NPA11_02740 [Mycoplasma sp. 1578d]UUM24631.1 hypothetical protein NPA12_02965 [Mycoplasma sp. 3686d]
MKLKRILFSLASPLITIPTVFSVSADPINNTQPPKENDKKDKNETPKTPPNYDQIKPKQEKVIEKEFLSALDRVEGNIINAIKRIEDLAEKPLSNELLVKIAYYKKVANFIKENTKEIVKNPEKFGFNTIFPKLLVAKQYHFGTVKYNNKEYAPTIIGESNPTNYDVVVKLDPKNSVKIEDKDNKLTINTAQEDEVLKTTNSYFSGISAQTEKIFINADDLPKFPDTTDFVLQENSQYDLKLPEGFKSWNEYIQQKINKQFLSYDLEQNVLFNQQNQPKPQPQQPPLPNTVPPLIDNDPDQGIPPTPEPSVENVPRLAPVLGFEKANASNKDLVALFQANSEVFNSKYVWFKNSILNSFAYQVTGLEEKDNKLIATVSLLEKTNPSNATQYTVQVQRYASAQQSASYQKVYQEFSEVFGEFLKALNLDEKHDYKSLGSNLLAQTVFNQVFSSVKLINTAPFREKVDQLVAKYQSKTTFSALDGSITNQALTQKARELLVNSLAVQEINEYKFFNYLANAYERLYQNLNFQAQKNIKQIEENFKNLDLDVNHLISSFKSLNSMLKTFKIIAIKSNFSAKDYQEYTQVLTDIHKQINNISALTKTQELKDKQDPQAKPFTNSYQDLNVNYQDKTSLNDILLWTFVGISVLGALGMFLMWMFKKILAKRKLSKEQNDK